MKEETTVEQAIEVIKQAMIKDEPEEKGSLAHVWHCNVAMCCIDAMNRGLPSSTPFPQMHQIGNEAATEFMKLCFDVNTSN